MRAADGHIKIVDFGLARVAAPVVDGDATFTRTGSLLGTPGYMAPEQLRGAPVDARVDVFAFGVMARELATGTHPFGGNDPAALVERMVSDAPLLSQHLGTSGLDGVVRRCLQAAPENRYASGTELYEALRAALAIAPTGDSDGVQRQALVVAVSPGRRCAALRRGADADVADSAMVGRMGISGFSRGAGAGDGDDCAPPASLVRVAGPSETFPAQRARLLPWIVAIETPAPRHADGCRDCDFRPARSGRRLARRHRPSAARVSRGDRARHHACGARAERTTF